jgi:hypothetical protein
MILADQIRTFATRSYIQPVRGKGSPVPSTVTIVCRDIVKGMNLVQRTPAVCSALDARSFQDDNNLKLIQRTGPKFGTTATWKFLV